MKKVYLILGLLAAMTIQSCGNSDSAATTAEETTDEPAEQVASPSEAGQNKSSDARVIEAYVNDKSGISIADLDSKDSNFTTRSKALYQSDENGKKLAVVYGFRSTPNGVAIIEIEGEKPVTLKQVETAPGAQYEFTNGSVTLKRINKAVQLNENGEVVTYKELL